MCLLCFRLGVLRGGSCFGGLVGLRSCVGSVLGCWGNVGFGFGGLGILWFHGFVIWFEFRVLL